MTNRAERIAGLSTTKLALLARQTYGQVEDILNAEPIAIIGMGLRFPGADDLAEFWQMLIEKRSAMSEVPKDRWDLERFYDPDFAAPGKMNFRQSGFLRQIDQFDPTFFGIPEREAAQMDPQQRLVLEVAYEALEEAGLADHAVAESDMGFFLASYHNDYQRMIYDRPEDIDLRSLTGSLHCISANRLSYLLNLHGPSMAVDSACSSSLVAVHLACQSLRARECDACLAGGVNAILTPGTNISLTKLGFLSPSGECHTFDAQADGFIRGEGCGIVVLKRLSDALTSGDRIFAVIRGSAVNQDGRSTVLTAPNGLAQQALIQRALRNAGLRPDQLGMIEAHGTGTHLGDPLEVEAISQVVGPPISTDHHCYLTSVKANIGHLEASAGVAGLIKTALCLYHGAIPPQPNFTRLNPEIKLEGTPLAIPTETIPWPEGERPRYAGVSSFGVGGTNAHIILGAAPVITAPVAETSAEHAYLLPISARSPQALIDMVQSYAEFLVGTSSQLYDMCYTASLRHSHYEYRMAVPGNTPAQMAERLSTLLQSPDWLDGVHHHKVEDIRPQIAFVFSGQGTQWAQMGYHLFNQEPVFREIIEKCDALLQPLSGWSLLTKLAAPEGKSDVDQTAVAQPAIFAVQIALDALWRSWGVTPASVVGHSLGEIAAACSAGILSLEDAIFLVYHRGRLMQQATGKGKMVSVELPAIEVERLVAPYSDEVAVAAINGPRATVISGPGEAVDAVLASIIATGARVRPLRVNYAFHSPMMAPYAQELEGVLGNLSPHPEQVPFISTVTGKLLPGQNLIPSYWGRNIRQTVHFADAVRQMVDQGISVFLEIGPHPALIPMIEQCLSEYSPDGNLLTASSLRRGQPEKDTLLDGLSRLYQSGVEVKWQYLYPERGKIVSLPHYCWQRKRFWLDEKSTQSAVQEEAIPGHPLLGRPVESPVFSGVLYQQSIASGRPAYLQDHQVFGQPVLPAAAMLEMMLQAAADQSMMGSFHLVNIRFDEAMLLAGDAQRTVQLHIQPDDNSGEIIEIYSKAPDGKWLRHATGQIQTPATYQDQQEINPVEHILQRCATTMTGKEFYARAGAVSFGPMFQGVQMVWRSDGEALAEIHLPEQISVESSAYLIHPALLDAALQPLTAALPASARSECYLPLSVAELHLMAAIPQKILSHVQVQVNGENSEESYICNIQLTDEHNQLLMVLQGLILKRTSAETMRRIFKRQAVQDSEHKGSGWLYQVEWETADQEPYGSSKALKQIDGHWIIFSETKANQDNRTDLLAEQIKIAGGSVSLIYSGEQYKNTQDGQVEIDPDQPEDYLALFQALEKEGSVKGIIDLRGLNSQDMTGSVDVDFARLRTALFLSQAILKTWPQYPPSLWFLTAGSQPARRPVTDQGAAALWGLANTLILERPDLSCTCLDLDPLATNNDQVRAIVNELQTAGDSSIKLDQIAYHDGKRLAAQLHETSHRPGFTARYAVRLGIDAPGQFESLSLQHSLIPQPEPGEVVIRVQAAGLNFRDILKVLGRYPVDAAQPTIQLGDECTGVIHAVGAEVTGMQVGDEVIALAAGCFASYITTPANLVFHKPEALTFEEAASLPITFLTAAYSLLHLAHLAKGQTVLIHAAAGGVGLAAVQLAQLVGAEVFATAGNPEKRAFLQSLGIQHIYDSRSLDFAEAIHQHTGGRGVDVILNSLAGDFISASFSVLAQGGCFLEIGKTGILTQEQATKARPDAAYHPVYLGELYTSDPALVREMMFDILKAVENNEIQPLPMRVFPIEQAQEAMRFMARARHIGKIVFKLPALENAPTSASESLFFRSDGIYLLTGGMGGIGRAALRWMSNNGAKHFALVSRSGENHPDAKELREELRAAGAQVQIYTGDAASMEDMQRIFVDLQKLHIPLRGVIHAAGVVMDGVALQQDWERYRAVLAGKAIGAWNLHQLTRHISLDHFILFSSIAGPLGSPGQSNYSAANVYLGALAHARRAEGLTALCVDWGAWERTGMTSRLDAASQQALARRGLQMIQPQTGTEAFGEAILQQVTECLILPVDWPVYLHETQSEKRFLFRNVQTRNHKAKSQAQPQHKASEPPKPRLLRLLEGTPAGQRRNALIQYIHQEVIRLASLPADQPIDPRQPLNTLGLDSLMAVEMRNALGSASGKSLPATLLFDYPTSEALASYLLQILPGIQDEVASAEQGIVHAAETEAVSQFSAQAVQELTDEEAEAELLAELAKLRKN